MVDSLLLQPAKRGVYTRVQADKKMFEIKVVFFIGRLGLYVKTLFDSLISSIYWIALKVYLKIRIEVNLNQIFNGLEKTDL